MKLLADLVANETVSGSPPPSGGPLPPIPPIEVRLSTAPVLYGSNLAWLLLGFLLLQTYHYYQHFRRDHILLKFCVYTAVIIELGQSGVETFVGYRYLVGGWGNPALFFAPHVTDLLAAVFDAIVGSIAQGFYIWRIWRFGGECRKTARLITHSICFLLGFLSLASVGGCLGIPILFASVTESNLNSVLPRIKAVTTIWAVCAAVTDVIITISTIIILRHARTNFAYLKRTRDIVSRFTRVVIQTGSVTSFLALFLIIAFLIPHTGDVYSISSYLLGKSYAMSLLANLNARSHGEPLIGEQSTTMSTSHPVSRPTNGAEDHIVSRLSRFQTATVATMLSEAQTPEKPHTSDDMGTDSEVLDDSEVKVQHIVVDTDIPIDIKPYTRNNVHGGSDTDAQSDSVPSGSVIDASAYMNDRHSDDAPKAK